MGECSYECFANATDNASRYIDTFGYDLPKVPGKGQIQFPPEDAFGYDLPKVRGKERIHLQKEERPVPLRLPAHATVSEAPFQFAPGAFRESIIPSAISPKGFEPTDLEELELLTKNLETSSWVLVQEFDLNHSNIR